MTAADNIEKFIKKTGLETKTEMNEVVRNRIFQAFEKSKQTKSTLNEPNIWRIIMKSNITKIAAAAVIIIAVALATNLWDKSTPMAYAIEQTIEAMTKVTTVHLLGTMVDGGKLEVWIKVNTETGENDYIYLDCPQLTGIQSPNEAYFYNKEANVVKHLKGGNHLTFDIRFGRFIEDTFKVAKSMNGEVEIDYEYDIGSTKQVILLAIKLDESTLECRIDPETKLPMSMNIKFNGPPQPGQLGQSFDEIFYDQPLPEGIFELEIPEGAEVVEK
jgi:hypothetical protein